MSGLNRFYRGKFLFSFVLIGLLGQKWGMGSPRFSKEQVVSWSRKVRDSGGVITWDVPIQSNSLISRPFINQLTAVGEALGRP